MHCVLKLLIHTAVCQGCCPREEWPRTRGHIEDRILWSWPWPWPRTLCPQIHWQIAMIVLFWFVRLNTTHVWAFAGITLLIEYFFIQFKTIFEFSEIIWCFTVVRSLLFLTGEWIGLLRPRLDLEKAWPWPRPWPRGCLPWPRTFCKFWNCNFFLPPAFNAPVGSDPLGRYSWFLVGELPDGQATIWCKNIPEKLNPLSRVCLLYTSPSPRD